MSVPPQPFILFTDLVGSTADALQDAGGAATRRRQMIEVTLGAIRDAGGYVGQYTGDGFLCLAPTLKEALVAGERIIREISATGQSVRVVIHYTDQLPQDIKFWRHDALEADADGILRASTAAFMYFEGTYGAIAFAARLLGCAHPNQILVSQRAHLVEGSKAADTPKWLTHPAQKFKDGQSPEPVAEYLWDGASKGVPRAVYVPSFYHRRLGLYVDRPALEDQVIRAIERGRDPQHPTPIVAIYGDGGMGKTRLAEAVTLRIAYQYRHIASISIVEDGIVDLNTALHLCDPSPEIGQTIRADQMEAIAERLANKIAERFGFVVAKQDVESSQGDFTVAFLSLWETFAKAHYPGLLVLDNWEPLNFRPDDPAKARACVALLNELVRRAPEWTILLTTRDRPLTEGLDGVSVDDGMTDPEAESLIRQRWAEADGPDPEASEILAMVRACGGYPLAIELAVSTRRRDRSLRLGDIAARIERDILNLSSSVVRAEGRAGRSRLASLPACLNYSYNLLTPDEQRVFRAAGAFVAPWTWATGNAVLHTTGEIQTALIEASRFRAAPVTIGTASAEVLSMHRHVWEFARGLLDAANERLAVEARLIIWTQAFLADPADATRFDALEIEEGNWSRGLRLLAREDSSAGVSFAYSLQAYASQARRFADLRRWSSDPELPESARAAALGLTGNCYFREGRNQDALDAWARADQYYQQSGDPQGRGDVARSRGGLHFHEGRNQDALDAWQLADQYYQQSGDPQGRGNVAASRGDLHFREGRNHDALDAWAVADQYYQQSGNPQGRGTVARMRGGLHFREGRNQDALDAWELADQYYQQSGDPQGRGNVARMRGDLHFQEGRNQDALQAWGLADQYYQQSGTPLGRGNVAASRGNLYFQEGRNQDAFQAWGLADQYYQQSGTPLGRGNVAASRGNLYFQEGRNQEAVTEWQTAADFYRACNHQHNLHLVLARLREVGA